VAIERLTRTARDQKLFHRAVVAPRSRFGMVITGENLDEREVALLVAALQGFDDPDDPILLGAETGSGKGRLTLGRESPVLQRIGPDELLAWLDETNPAKAGPAFRVLTDRERESIFDTAAELTSRASGSQVALDVDIRMDGPFLVNDPQPKRDSNSSHEDGPPDHRPRRDHAGRTLLPAKSVRGVLRARAERVVRTLGGHACRVDDPRAACDAIDDLAEIQNLCLACRTFGAPGWRSPLAVSDFTLVEERSTALRQEFVAIDRFTGGGAEKLKFNAEAAIDPHFKGEIGFDLLRGELWMAGLLALVLRDMCEGDLTFGFGAAKGYGAAVAFVSGWRLGGLDAPPVTAALSNIDIAADALPQEGTALTPAIAAALEKTIQAFRSKIRGEGT
jgi:CRISPR/Cas system CSM-associated protein Csm3 (group 7 of RAMP superfamily)